MQLIKIYMHMSRMSEDLVPHRLPFKLPSNLKASGSFVECEEAGEVLASDILVRVVQNLRCGRFVLGSPANSVLKHLP